MCCLSLRTVPLLRCAARHCQIRIWASNIEIKQGPQTEHEICSKSKTGKKVIFFMTVTAQLWDGGAGGFTADGRDKERAAGCSLIEKVWLKVVSACCSFPQFNYRWNCWELCCSER